jgi:hypothetical protein
MYKKGIKPKKVAIRRTFLRNFISPNPLNKPSKTKAIEFMGNPRIRIKKIE